LGESILWCSRRRVLYWTDIVGCMLWRHDPVSEDSQACLLVEPAGCLALSDDGRLLLGLANGLYAADVDQLGITPTLQMQKLVDVEGGDPFTRINDGRADRNGGFVFGTKSLHADNRRAGRFYQYTARHGLRELALPAAAIPNSICFDASGQRMYFCDSLDPRILSCHYDAANAAVSDIRVFVEIDTPGTEPDGSIIDAEGALWNAQWGAGQVVRYLPDGRTDQVVTVPATQASCCIIADESLYITTARSGLSPDALALQPEAGGVFQHRLRAGLARSEDRVVLP